MRIMKGIHTNFFVVFQNVPLGLQVMGGLFIKYN